MNYFLVFRLVMALGIGLTPTFLFSQVDHKLNVGEGGQFNISGQVVRWGNGEPMIDVEINLTDNDPVHSNIDGEYFFQGIEAGENYLLSPFKFDNQSDGVTILDAIVVQELLLGPQFPVPYVSPYQAVAADVNRNLELTTNDLVLLKKMILGSTILEPWTFVPADFLFVDEYPLSIPYPTSIFLEEVNQNFTEQNFIGIKNGDVVQEELVPVVDFGLSFKLKTNYACDGLVDVYVEVENFNDIQGCQFSISWVDNLLEFVEVKFDSNIPGLSENQLNLNQVENGQLACAWFLDDSADVFSLPNGSTFLRIRFQPLDLAGSTVVFSENIIPTLVVTNEEAIAQASYEDGFVTLNTTWPNSNDIVVEPASSNLATDGSILIESVFGGTPPYTLLLNGEAGGPLFSDLAPGTYSLEMVDVNGCSTSKSIEVDFPSSINENISDETKIELRPNPVRNGANIQMQMNLGMPELIKTIWYDINMRLVLEETIDVGPDNSIYTLHTPSLPGIYFCKIFKNDGEHTVEKVLVN